MDIDLIFRNVTNTYFYYRREIKKKKNRFKLSEYEKLDDDEICKKNILSHNEDIEMQEQTMLPPQWIEKIEECSEDINNIKSKLLELNKLQKNKLLNVLNNDEKLAENITHMSADLTFLIKNCEQKIQSISNNNQDDKNNIVEKLKKNAKHSLASQLQSLSQTFHKKQKNYIKEFKKLSSEYDQIEPYQNYNKEESIIYERANEVSTVNISKRNNDLKKIADTVIELHTIFKELSVMLVDQGSLLDQIDYNIDITLDKSEQGLNKLKILQKRENNKRAKKCITFLTSLIFVLLILIIIKHVF